MDYDTSRHGDVTVYALKEEKVGYPGLEEFQNVINAEVARGTTLILIDLSRVKFLDSFGIGLVAGLHRKLLAAGGGLKLCGINDRIMMSLTLTRLDKVLDIRNDQAAAFQAFAVGAQP